MVAALTQQSLINSENLTLPSFQVIVMTANLGCAQCRQRVSQVTSKIRGLREYTVDVPNRQVIIKGDCGFQSKLNGDDSPENQMKGGCFPLKYFLKSFRPTRLTKIVR